MAASGAGSGLGYTVGEIPNRAIREAYGYPVPSWGQEAKNVGSAAAWGAAMPPAFWVAGKLAPATLKAGIRTVAEYPGKIASAGRALKDFADELTARLGVTQSEAMAIAKESAIPGERDFIRTLPRRMEKMLDHIERIPDEGRRLGAMWYLRDQIGAYVRTAGDVVGDEAQKLVRIKQAMRQVPERMFKRLYNSSRAELEDYISTIIKEHGRWLRHPELSEVVADEMNKVPFHFMGHIKRHLLWVIPWTLLRFMTGHDAMAMIPELALSGSAAGVLIGMSAAINSPPMRQMYLRLLTAQSATQARLITQAIISALIAQAQRSYGQQQFAGPGTPEPSAPADIPEETAPPVPRGTPTPAAMPTPRPEPGPPPPSASTLEIPGPDTE
jgi:hypothetical protein